MSEEKTVTVTFTALEVECLVEAARLGLATGQLIEIFKTTAQDFALIEAIAKMHKAMRP
jgi:hypothetical protein